MAIDKGTDEYFKKLKVATDFCNGSVEMAKKMLSGEYKDNLAIKGRFKDSNDSNYGLFFIIINQVINAKIYLNTVTAEYASIWETKPFVDWKTFAAKVQKEVDYDSYNINLTSKLTSMLNKNLNKQNNKKIFELVRVNDIMQLTAFFNKIVSKSLNISSVEATVDFERISSMDVNETLGVSVLDVKSSGNGSGEEDPQEKLEKLIREIKDLEKKYQGKIIKAKTEVSPIKGKYIHEIKRNDTISVIINDNIPIAIDIAKKKGVFTVGQMGAFPADVIVNVKTKNGFMIYAGPVEGAIFKIPEKAGIKINVHGYEGSPIQAKNKGDKAADKEKNIPQKPVFNYQDHNQYELGKYKKQDRRTYLLFILLPLIIIGLIIYIITILF